MGQKIRLAPAWMRSIADGVLRQLDTETHDKAVTVSIAVLGEEGYEFGSAENMQSLEAVPALHLLLEGHAMVAGSSLAVHLKQTARELAATKDLPADTDEAFIEMRRIYEGVVRAWLRSTMMYAGQKFQSEEDPGPSMAAGSQILQLFQRVASSNLVLQDVEPKDKDAPSDDPATTQQSEAFEIAQEIDQDGEGLTGWEINFIADVIKGHPRDISEKMITIIEGIYQERVQ